MQLEEYKKMFFYEDFYWWYKGARRILLNQLEKYVVAESCPNILDVGCGTGKVLELLNGHKSVVGMDISGEAIRFTQLRKNRAKLVQADALYLPFRNSTYNCLIAFDILCTLENDEEALTEFNRVLKKDARLIINLPSYNWLMSKHDAAVFTKRRYNKKRIIKMISRAGFKIEKVTYWNIFLFPLEALVRFTTKLLPQENCKSDLYNLPKYINSLFSRIIYLEAKLIKKINFPYGLSLLMVAKKE